MNDPEIVNSENNQEIPQITNTNEKKTQLKESFIDEEQSLTQADSEINQTMKKSKHEPHKKNKGFTSVFNKPIQKNFFFGGDYSDLFNVNNEEETKKFKTVKITKKNNLSNKIRGFIDKSRDSEEESKRN